MRNKLGKNSQKTGKRMNYYKKKVTKKEKEGVNT
jgi:hypothetical protein